MIGGLTNYGQLKVLNALKGGRSLGIPTNWRVAAFSTNPVAGGFGGVEANYPGYARVVKTNTPTDWAAPTGSGGTITSANATEIDFPAGTTGANQVLTGIGLFDNDASAVGGGDCWAFYTIPAGQQPTIGVGTVYQIPIGNLILEFLCGATAGYTDFAAKKILTSLLGGAALGQPATYFLGAFTATPGPTGGGTESTRASYGRQGLGTGQGPTLWTSILTPTKAQAKTAAGATGTTSTIVMTNPSVVGNVMVLTVMWSSATVTLNSITDSAGNTWKILTTQQTSANSNNVAVAICRNITTAVTLTITATFSASATTPWFGASEWSNVQDVNYNSLTKAALATSTAPSQNMNVGVSGEVVIAAIYANAAATSITTAAGWTLEGSNGNQQSFSDIVLSATNTDNPAYAAAPVTFGATQPCAIITLGLIPASTATLAQSQSQWGPAVNFPTLGGTGSENWISWGLFDASTVGNLWLFGQLANSLTISSGSVPQFPANSIAGIMVSSTS